MNDNCILVFTSRSIEQMLAQGGSQAWVLDARRARRHRYVVCAWNSTGAYAKNSGERQHGEAYVVAPITSVESAGRPKESHRYIIRFGEFAHVSVPNAWPHGQRNPVFYTTLHDLGIDPDSLKFVNVPIEPAPPVAAPAGRPATAPPPNGEASPLTIVAAKRGLAAHYGVATDAIEIIIRG
jgi:hypothetical protein